MRNEREFKSAASDEGVGESVSTIVLSFKGAKRRRISSFCAKGKD